MRFKLLYILILTNLICFSQPYLSIDKRQEGVVKNIAGTEISLKVGYEFKATSSDWMHSFLDETYNTFQEGFENTSSLTELNLDTKLPVGRIEGAASVSLYGTPSYEIPLLLVNSVNSLQPELSLVYNSTNPDGVLGVGWTINGLSSIKMKARTIYHKNFAVGLSGTSQDMFSLDGNILIPIGGTINGEDNAEYRTEKETFQRVKSYGNINNLPLKFTVETKSGLFITYGGVGKYKENKGIEYLGSDYSPMEWLISSIKDRNGNIINYHYNNTDIKEISRIDYGINESSSPLYSVEFVYQERENSYNKYELGNVNKVDKVLSKINSLIEGNLFKQYRIRYSTSPIYQLNEVFEYGNSGGHFNSTKFKYDEKRTELATLISGNDLGDIHDDYDAEFSTNDFNNDGIVDLLAVYPKKPSDGVRDYFKIFQGNGDGSFTEAHREELGGTFTESFFTSIINTTDPRQNFIHADFNGDGYGDILIVKYSESSKTTKVFSSEYINRYSPVKFMRITGIVAYINKGDNTFESQSFSVNSNINSIENGQGIGLGDFNGDGATDIFMTLTNENEKEVNWKGETINDYEFKQETTIILPKLDETHVTSTFEPSQTFSIVDFDGDGKNEIYSMGYSYSSLFEPVFSETGLNFIGRHPSNSYSGNDVYRKWWTILDESTDAYGYTVAYNLLTLGDYNGDGKTDFFSRYFHEEQKDAWLSFSDNYTQKIEQGTHETKEIFGDAITKNFKSGDFNGDGFDDLIEFEDNKAIVWLSEGKFFGKKLSFDTPDFNEDEFMLSDFNSDGISDLFYTSSTGEPKLILINKENSIKLLTEVLDGLGKHTIYDYATYKSLNTITSDIDLGINSITKYPKYLACKTLSEKSKNEDFSILNFEYGDFILNTQGKGITGISSQTTKSLNTNSKTEKYFSFENEFQSTYLSSTSTSQLKSPFNEISKVIIEGSYKDLGNKRFYFTNDKITTHNYLNNSTKEENFEYSEEGNLIRLINQKGVIGKPFLNSITTETAFKKQNTWLKASKAYETITMERTGETPYVRTIDYKSYDEKGNLEEIILDPLDINSLKEVFSYNSWGQLVSKKTIGNNHSGSDASEVSEFFEYDDKHRKLVYKNIANQNSIIQYDQFNRVISEEGINKLRTFYKYDQFNRKTEIRYPSGLTSVQNYIWSISNNDNSTPDKISTLYGIITETEGLPLKEDYFDEIGRIKIHKTKDESESFNIEVSAYNKEGLLKFETLPFKMGNEKVVKRYEYDSYLRLTREKFDGLDPVIISYSKDENGLSISTSDPIGESFQLIDGTGKIIKITDNNGSKLFHDYYSNGNIKVTKLHSDGVEKVINQFKYNLQGSKSEFIDINAGKIIYKYNSFGQLISENNNEKITDYNYNSSGLLKSETTSEGLTMYEYFNEGPAINKIKLIKSPDNINVGFEYDTPLGRLKKKTQSIDGNIFETNYGYNSFGQVNYIKYPSDFEIEYEYSKTGEQISIINKLTNSKLWEKGEKNSLGLYTSYKLGNGKESTIEYDKFGNLRKKFTEGVSEQLYSFNQSTGNLILRKDEITDNYELFNYDGLDRLSEIYQNNITSFDKIEYFANGNIKIKPTIGNYQYSTGKINAVSSIASIKEEHIDIHPQILTEYTTFNKLKEIEENNHRLVFHYGADKERKKVDFYEEGGLKHSKFYLDNFEQIQYSDGSKKEINYIPSPTGNQLVALGNGLEHEIKYLYNDHLGSPIVVTNQEGIIEHTQSFDAWGRKRNPVDLSYEDIPSSPYWLRGYTGHEHYEMFKLINMNGRLYDPVIGRFFSPDNFIQEPSNIQNFNRYSYALNNPLKYTDPSGWFSMPIGFSSSHGGGGGAPAYGQYIGASGAYEKGRRYVDYTGATAEYMDLGYGGLEHVRNFGNIAAPNSFSPLESGPTNSVYNQARSGYKYYGYGSSGMNSGGGKMVNVTGNGQNIGNRNFSIFGNTSNWFSEMADWINNNEFSMEIGFDVSAGIKAGGHVELFNRKMGLEGNLGTFQILEVALRAENDGIPFPVVNHAGKDGKVNISQGATVGPVSVEHSFDTRGRGSVKGSEVTKFNAGTLSTTTGGEGSYKVGIGASFILSLELFMKVNITPKR